MGLRKARSSDLKEILEIIDEAKAFLKESGIDQWQDGYPNHSIILEDILRDEAYVFVTDIEDEEIIVSYVMLSFHKDPDYSNIKNGKWLSTSDEYAVLHRLAVSSKYRGDGYASQVIRRLSELAKDRGLLSLRADTHQDNLAMQRTLESTGFERCGDVLIRGTDPRIAYELIF